MKVAGFLWGGKAGDEGGQALVESGLGCTGVQTGVLGRLRGGWSVVKDGGLDDVLQSGGEVDVDGRGRSTGSHDESQTDSELNNCTNNTDTALITMTDNTQALMNYSTNTETD